MSHPHSNPTMIFFHIALNVLILVAVGVLHGFTREVPFHPLYLIPGSWLGSYLLTRLAGHSSRGVATRPVTGDLDQRGQQPDPAPGIPNAAAWYLESAQPDVGLPHSCSFVEFDERGDYLDFRQHRHAYEKIRNLARTHEHLVIVIFVHGWRNNAHSSNVVSFNEFLHQLSTFSDRTGVKHRVHGVYLSWRGGCLKHGLDQRDEVFSLVTARYGGQPIVDLRQAARWLRFNEALETFSYFDRKGVPEHLFSGTSLSRTIFSCAHAAKRYRPKGQVFLIGHSFGGLLLERTFQNATIGELSKAWAWGDPAQISETQANPLPFDTVLLVNSAAPSIYAKQFQSYMAAHRQAMVRDKIRGANSPIFFSLTSTGDWATGKTHPLANRFCGILPTLRRKYWGGDFILEALPENAEVEIPQSYYYRHTPGHNPLLVNRFIEPSETAIASAGGVEGKHVHANLHTDVVNIMEFITTARPGKKTMGWTINFPPVTEEFRAFSTYQGRRPVAWTRGARRQYLQKESAYWIVRCPKEIIFDHNDIWSQQAMDTYAALYRISLVLRDEDLAKKDA